MKKLLLLLFVIAVVAGYWGFSHPADAKRYAITSFKTSGTYLLNLSKKLSGETVDGGSGESGNPLDNVYFTTVPVDTAGTPWTGLLRAGTAVVKVSEFKGKAIIDTGGGQTAVDPATLTRDAEQITAILKAVAAAPPPPTLRPVTTLPNPERTRLQAQMTSLDQKISQAQAELATLEAKIAEAKANKKTVYGTDPNFLRNSVSRLEVEKAVLQRKIDATPMSIPAPPAAR